MAFSAQQGLNSLFALLSAAIAQVREFNLHHPAAALAPSVLEKVLGKQTLLAVVWAFGGSLTLEQREEFATWVAGTTTVAVPGGGGLLDYEVDMSDGEWVAIDSKVPVVEIESHRITASDVLIATDCMQAEKDFDSI